MTSRLHRKRQPELLRRKRLDYIVRIAVERVLAGSTMEAASNAAVVKEGGLNHRFPTGQALVEGAFVTPTGRRCGDGPAALDARQLHSRLHRDGLRGLRHRAREPDDGPAPFRLLRSGRTPPARRMGCGAPGAAPRHRRRTGPEGRSPRRRRSVATLPHTRGRRPATEPDGPARTPLAMAPPDRRHFDYARSLDLRRGIPET